MSSQSVNKNREMYKNRAVHFLERYCVLLILAEYFEEHLPDEENPKFSEWFNSRKEFKNILSTVSLQ